MSDPISTQSSTAADASGPDAAALLKVILDEERLAILGLLAQRPHTQAALADALPGRRTPLAKQLGQLVAAGLVKAEDDRYALDVQTIQGIKRSLFARPAAPPAETTAEQVLATFVRNGKLVQYPAQHAKRMVILCWLAGSFEPGQTYTEPEVNARLAGHCEDHATLRRYLVDQGLLERERGVYRRGTGDAA